MHLGRAVPKALLMCFLFTIFIKTSLPYSEFTSIFFFQVKKELIRAVFTDITSESWVRWIHHLVFARTVLTWFVWLTPQCLLQAAMWHCSAQWDMSQSLQKISSHVFLSLEKRYVSEKFAYCTRFQTWHSGKGKIMEMVKKLLWEISEESRMTKWNAENF